MGSKFFAIGALIIYGVIAADVLIHPAGTAAVGNAAAVAWKPIGNSLLGFKQ